VTEELLITLRANPHVDPVLSIWGWEIPLYLYLGGLTAGLMIFAAATVLMRAEDRAPFAGRQAILWAPIILSVGMLFLFLDLEHPLYVYRFYTTFEPTSPMSWGSWFLVLVYPASIALILASLRVGYPSLAGLAERVPLGPALLDLAERWRRPLAAATVVSGVALGIYTGVLLSAFNARPFWNTGVLGPLFLISGLSTAAALIVLAARHHESEKALFTRLDIGLILVELVLITLLVINLATGAQPQIEAAREVLGGRYTVVFWVFFVGLGLLIPVALEVLELKGMRIWFLVAPVLVLAGGYLLRQVTVEIGQVTTWHEYAEAYDARLLERLGDLHRP
jgi:formate-dependent nitrite reductase membrane component NrfD